jgi:hypothetical protein
VNEHARVFKKLFKASTFDREAKERINTAFDSTIQKLRSAQAALTIGSAEQSVEGRRALNAKLADEEGAVS